jgi:serine kinase of HPr protein (carbohydrate metabolism regulator)
VRNVHATGLIIGDRGLMVAGPSGSGKTALCMALMRHCLATNVFVRLVADDQLYIEQAGGRLIARAPEPTGGLVEVRGFRPSPLAHEVAMVVDCLVRLVPVREAPRFSDDASEAVDGHELPCLRVPERNVSTGVSAVSAWLGLPPFAKTGPGNSVA